MVRTTTFSALSPLQMDTASELEDATIPFQAVAIGPPRRNSRNKNEKVDDPENGIYYYKFKYPPPMDDEDEHDSPTSPKQF